MMRSDRRQLYMSARLRLRRHPKQALLVVVGLWLAICLFTFDRLVHHKDFGRWFWNYAISWHPALAHIVPIGDWTPCCENPPRWFPDIYEAPWMGTFQAPTLSAPVYNKEGLLISPVIAKLNIFSTVTEEARQKRHLIRSLTVLDQLPPAYRHLVEVKFVLGHAQNKDGTVNEQMEAIIDEEQKKHGDLIRLKLKNGENLREGKLLNWIRAVGAGEDGGRPGQYLFKVDDDSILSLPKFLDVLVTLNPQDPIYLGTSLNRWPAFHAHMTGMVTGFSWPLVETLTAGITNMPRSEIEAWYDDDVLTGEVMYNLPSAPNCRAPAKPDGQQLTKPAYCDPRTPPPWGWVSNPPNKDPRTGLIRYDFLRRMADPKLWFFCPGDIVSHSWHYKFLDDYKRAWTKRIKGKMWNPPRKMKALADPNA